MKKVICLVLSVLLIALCGCSVPETISENVNKLFGKDKPFNFDIETFISDKLKDSDLVKVKETAVTPDGIHTLCYEKLTKAQKRAYRIMLTAANEMTEGWFACLKYNDDFEKDIAIAYSAMSCDNPQIFWLPQGYMLATTDSQACVAFKYHDDEFTNDYTIPKDRIKTMKADLNEKVNEIVTVALQLETDYERELFVHDYICDNAEYDLDGGKVIYTSYGALASGVCVCEGYSRGMQLIMQNLGIPCGLIYGEYNDEGHMWNCIQIEGNIYHLDLTWDDDEELGCFHTYFNLNEAEILKSHSISPLFTEIKEAESAKNYNILKPSCTSNAANFFERNNLYLTDDTAKNIDAILYCVGAGFSRAELCIRTNGDVDAILNEASNRLWRRFRLKQYIKTGNTVLVYWN